MRSKGSTKKVMRFLSMLLAVFLFLGSQGFIVFTETISGNGAEPEGGNIETEEENAKTDPTYSQDSGNPQQEIFLDGNVSEKNVRVGAGTPANPIHHCTKEDDGIDYTDFSYVYFGSYPQSEVTDSLTI
ncbi:MAG: hypothetical protein HDR01_13560 [Lachnospiraceae bacterium]|nr:hypothetical protein [Lachnospiraceae bacterium]